MISLQNFEVVDVVDTLTQAIEETFNGKSIFDDIQQDHLNPESAISEDFWNKFFDEKVEISQIIEEKVAIESQEQIAEDDGFFDNYFGEGVVDSLLLEEQTESNTQVVYEELSEFLQFPIGNVYQAPTKVQEDIPMTVLEHQNYTNLDNATQFEMVGLSFF